MSPLGAVGIVSAIEAVRDGHGLTVIEALGFEPEALVRSPTVAEHRRSTLANEANRRAPKQSRIQGRTNSLQHGCFLSGRIARQTRAEFPPIKVLAAPGVRIHPSPPHSLACFPTLWRSDEIGAWGAIHARPWTRRMPTAAAGGENRLKFSVRDFGMSICEPADILRSAEPVLFGPAQAQFRASAVYPKQPKNPSAVCRVRSRNDASRCLRVERLKKSAV